jgi:hypothetical protein
LISDDLRKAVEQLHNCKAQHIEDVKVIEKFGQDTVWEGMVSIFKIEGHPNANKCYAWSHSLDDSNKRRYFAVLHQSPVDSPQAAVKAAIVNEFRRQNKHIY